MTERKKSGRGLNIALGILVVIWIMLLAVTLSIFVMRLQGYQTVEEWLERKEQPAEEQPSKAPIPSKKPELTEAPTKAPTKVPTKTPTKVPTKTPTPETNPTTGPTERPTETPMPTKAEEITFLEALKLAGEESIDADIRRQATEFAGDEMAELAYEVYQTGNYLSVVFHKVDEFEGELVDTLLPLVYDLTTKKQVTGSDLIKESYFAIIKERLQTYVAENFPASEGTEFITYSEIYQAEDYEQIYLTEDTLGFWFAENTLFPEGQKPFSYQVSLEEAKAFFYYNLDGTVNGIPIRELDPDKPMLAFTFDDGPDLEKVFRMDNLDWKLVELFKRYDGRATFFFLGNRVGYNEVDGTNYLGTYGRLARKIYEEGFEVASHSHTHTLNFGLEKEEKKAGMWQEYNRANEAIAAATGHAPDYIRLPGGTVGKWALEFPTPIINWNKDTVDYQYKNKSNGAEMIAERMMKRTYQDGDIILCHSIYQNTYDAMVILLEYLDAQGFQFVTLSELFYYRGVTPENGVVYKKVTAPDDGAVAQ